jgi:hypothetical protein
MQTHSIKFLDAIDDRVDGWVTAVACVGLDAPNEGRKQPAAQVRFAHEVSEVDQFSLLPIAQAI